MTVLVHKIIDGINDKEVISDKISSLPHFIFNTLNGESFNSDEILTGPLLLIRFHPECDHCKYEIEEITRLPGSDLKVLLISDANTENVINFMKQFDIRNKSNIIPLIDSENKLNEIFGMGIIPSNFIYNSNLKLVKVLSGEHKTETLLKYLNTHE